MNKLVERLSQLRITPFRLYLETTGPFAGPEYKGALFRGGFGKFLRDLECTTGLAECTGCMERRRCFYSRVFESPADPATIGVLRKGTNLPHPFVLTPPLDASRLLPAGSALQLELTLIGDPSAMLPVFLRSLDAMGRAGTFGGPFRVAAVAPALQPHLPVYLDGVLTGEAMAWKPREVTTEVDEVRLEFVTPLRLRVNGRYTAQPTFVAVIQSLLRRIHLLLAVYAGQPADSGWLRPLYEAADRIRTVHARFTPWRLDRFSGRQQRTVPMDGVSGTLVVRGHLTPLVPFLEAGEWLNAGSQTALGLGRYRAGYIGQTTPAREAAE